MKKHHCLFILLLCCRICYAQTSVYHPFPDSNAIWNISAHLNCTSGDLTEYYSYYFSGDTTIASQTYHKLNLPFVQEYISGSCSIGTLIGYAGCIREDSMNKKVFIIPPDQNSEQLLYDFNMQVGDTVKGFIEPSANPTDVVESIDSILVGSDFRKRWNINSGYSISIIEGIGSTYGLIMMSPGNLVDFPDYSITCFSQNGITLYPDTAVNCDLISSIENASTKIFPSTIFPNPFITQLNIAAKSNEALQVCLYDILGRKLFTQSFTGSTTINTQPLATGLYIYEVRNKNGVLAKGKVVKE